MKIRFLSAQVPSLIGLKRFGIIVRKELHLAWRQRHSLSINQKVHTRFRGHFTGNRNGDSNLGAMPGLQRSLMSRPSKLRLILAEDHPVLREGLSLILDLLPDMAVAGQASTGEEAFELFLKLEPDV